MTIGIAATIIGYELAANLSQTFASAILLLTPLAFLFSTARNSRELADVVALVLGLVLYPLASLMNSGVDILVSGLVGGTIAFGVHKWRGVGMSAFFGDWHPLVVLVLAGVIPNQIWRMLGLCLGSGLDEGSDLLMWVKAVATAIRPASLRRSWCSRPARWRACLAISAMARWSRALPPSCWRGARSLPAFFAARSSCF